MTDKCKDEGCQLHMEGHCPEHKKEVERRRNTDRVVKELQESKAHFLQIADSMSRSSKRLTKMFWITGGTLFLLVSGVALSYYMIAHVDQASRDRYELGMGAAESLRQDSSEINQQSINRDHLIIKMVEGDRAMNTELVKVTERVVTKLENIADRLERMEGRDEDRYKATRVYKPRSPGSADGD